MHTISFPVASLNLKSGACVPMSTFFGTAEGSSAKIKPFAINNIDAHQSERIIEDSFMREADKQNLCNSSHQ